MYLFFSVGEPSGDQHAAHLISELRKRHTLLETGGFGGPLMQRSGCQLLFRLTDLAVMGIFAIIPMLLKFWNLYRLACRSFDARRPDAVILIDFPGFNWHIARAAKRRGIPVYYYMPPQLWAWAPWRIKKARKSVDLILSGLPFERDWYASRGVPVAYVGHPFFDEVVEHRLEIPFLEERCTTATAKRNVAILPGSRSHELQRNWPSMLEVMRNLSALHGNLMFRVACYKEAHREWLEREYAQFGVTLPVEFCVGRTSEILELAECCLMVSGSVSLEVMARRTPAVVVYRGGPLTYFLSKIFLTCKFITLPNLIADRVVMPEFLYSGDRTAIVSDVTRLLDRWLYDPEVLALKRRDMELLAAQAGELGGIAKAAETILERLGGTVAMAKAA